ncbi:MAG: hypothetical protein OXK82_05560 [Deltaproteobacteria bacterium]|nr:hypothetical protein [Deltaproteobacteria bacterium]
MPNEEAHKLGNTAVRRKAGSVPPGRSGAFQSAADTVEMHTGYSDTEERQLWLSFETSASGGSPLTLGRTDYRILIGVDDYAAIIKAMCDVDEHAVLSAMADELAARLRVP